MLFERKKYLDLLIEGKGNGLVKIVTGIRRCGKSFLLFELFRKYLLDTGVQESHIIALYGHCLLRTAMPRKRCHPSSV